MLDITLVENLYNFLSGLEKDGFIAKEINLKVVNSLRNGKYYKKYSTLDDFYQKNKEILENKTPNRYCQVGDLVFIENIKFENTVSNYLSEFYYYNVTSRNPISRDKTKFDYKRNDFYKFDISKYKEYLKESLLSNLQTHIDLANTRLSSYVDACYVDPNYVDNIPTIKDSIENDF